MKSKKIFFLIVVAFSISICSCKKDTGNAPNEGPVVNEPSYNNANVQALFVNLATPVQTYTINATSNHSFICANGTTISISPNSFLNQSGGSVTGAISIEVKDILSKKDMVLNNAMPVSNGQLLVSGGEIYFNATQGGQKLKVKPTSSIRIKIPVSGPPSAQMLEFYSPGNANLSNSNLNWATNTATIAAVQDTSGWMQDFHSDSIGWSNCDYFYNIPGAKTTCTVTLTGSFNSGNTAVFISMNGVNTMANIHPSSYSVASQEFMSYLNSIPVGNNYTILAMSFDGTNYYYSSQSVTMTANVAINLPVLTQLTKTQLLNNLSTLP